MAIYQEKIFIQESSKLKAFFLGLGCFFLAWRLWGRFDWFVPSRYVDNDFFFTFVLIKRLMDGIWYFNTSYTGFPFGGNFLDYPGSDVGNFAVLKIVAVLTHNLALTVNLYVFLGYSVIAIASYWVSQKLQLTKISSLVVAAFFASLIFIGSGIVGSLKWRSSKNIGSAFIAVAIIATGVGLNVAPNINFWFKNGPNQEGATRFPFESEV